MSRTLLRIFAVLVFAGAALVVQADTFNVAALNLSLVEDRESPDRVALLRPTESSFEPATLLVFGVSLGLAAWRVRKNGVSKNVVRP